MNLLVLVRMVPDTVDELIIAEDGRSLEIQSLRMRLSDPDEHALEEALLLKGRYGGKVTVVTLEAPEVDEALFTALAKGADRAVKLIGDWSGHRAPSIARAFSSFLTSDMGLAGPDTLILTGSQAIDDLEGEVAPYAAEDLHLPYLGVVTGVELDVEKAKAVATKEFSGGLRGQFQVHLPAVLGIQAAERPPRYVPVARIRAIMRSARIEAMTPPPSEAHLRCGVDRMYKPEAKGRAEMLEGSPGEVAARLADILAEGGFLGRR